MPDLLKKRLFQPRDILHPAVQSFYCGNEPWEREVSDWIKGGPDGQSGVIVDMQRPSGCEVWLYRTQNNILVGFGSLSEPPWPYPLKGDPHPNLIPMLGVRREFWGEPRDVPKAERYSAQIMDDLQNEARKHSDRSPAIVLYVHPDNARAIKFYKEAGFDFYTRKWRDPATNVVYRTMRLHL